MRAAYVRLNKSSGADRNIASSSCYNLTVLFLEKGDFYNISAVSV